MQKTVNLEGRKIKVNFQRLNNKLIKGSCGDIDGWEMEHFFSVNGKIYSYISKNKETKKGTSTKIYFNNIQFPDSEKKIIEYILTN